MKTIIYLVIILIFTSCKYYQLAEKPEQIKSNEAEGLFPANTEILLDSTYSYFIRQSYAEDSNDFIQMKTNYSLSKESFKKLIEVEYILYSKERSNFLYFSTRPDKTRNYYTKNFLGKDSINIRDFRVLFFGKVDTLNKLIRFTEKNNIHNYDLWLFDINSETITINNIKEYKNSIFNDFILLDEALAEPIQFSRRNNFELYFYNPVKKSAIAYPMKNKILIKQENNKYWVFFEFKNNENELSEGIQFKNKHIKYRPDQLLK